jgi:hypothetical protein
MAEDFQIAGKLSPETVEGYLEKYWGLNQISATKAWSAHKCSNKGKLPRDIAEVCAFLSDRDKVIAGLEPLEQELVRRLESMTDLKQKIELTKGKAHPDLFKFSTDKLLSGVLDDEEQANGFNGATSTLRKLHTEAEYVDGSSSKVTFDSKSARPGNLLPYNPEKKGLGDLTPMPLPKGAPTLTGLLVKSFNPILLKNGYHWKDPGAGDSHGEFTHRLQWYVLTKAWNKTLPAANAPFEVFTAMGFLAAAGGNPSKKAKDEMEQRMKEAGSEPEAIRIRDTSGVTIVYLWEMACDCFQSGTTEAESGKPWSNGFNCPDVFNRYLSNPVYSGEHRFPVLHALVRARRGKRATEAGAWLTKILEGKKDYKFAVTSQKDVGNIVWKQGPQI